jgi:hypothetical protein
VRFSLAVSKTTTDQLEKVRDAEKKDSCQEKNDEPKKML